MNAQSPPPEHPAETEVLAEFGLTDSPLEASLLRRLHADLARKAVENEVLDIAYRTVPSPFGDLLLASTPTGLLRVAFSVEGHDQVLQELSNTVSPRILNASAELDQPARELEQYFAGLRREFTVRLDLQLVSGFRRAVLDHLPDIPYGATATYAEVAYAAGSPRASRAVGSACANNPLPIVLPCHRVVRSDGQPGGYLGGPKAKHALLTLERSQPSQPTGPTGLAQSAGPAKPSAGTWQ